MTFLINFFEIISPSLSEINARALVTDSPYSPLHPPASGVFLSSGEIDEYYLTLGLTLQCTSGLPLFSHILHMSWHRSNRRTTTAVLILSLFWLLLHSSPNVLCVIDSLHCSVFAKLNCVFHINTICVLV